MIADTLSVLLVAVPMGKLGDKYGRRKIMALSLIGVAGWLGEIFTVCTYHLRFMRHGL
jgi:MFS family permease